MNKNITLNQKPLFHKDFLLVVIGQIISFGRRGFGWDIPIL